MNQITEYSQPENNLLDFYSNKDFLSKVLEGDLSYYKKLEKWFNEQKLNNKIDKSQIHTYELILKGYSISKEKNFKLEQIDKEKKDLEFINSNSDKMFYTYFDAIESKNKLVQQINAIQQNLGKEIEEKLITQKEEIKKEMEEKFQNQREEMEAKIQNQKEEIKQMQNQREEMEARFQGQREEMEEKIQNQKEEIKQMQNQREEMEEKIQNQKEEIKQMQNQREVMEAKLQKQKEEMDSNIFNNKINVFIQNINNYILLKNTVISDSIVKYTGKKFEMNDLRIKKLTALINELYSFKNVYIYRKIINILLKKILVKYKADIAIDSSSRFYVKTKKIYTNGLSLLIDFFFFVKLKTNSIIHLLRTSKELIKKIQHQEPLTIEEIYSLKDINSFLEDIENCNYENLINTFNFKIPLMFFSKAEINKEKNVEEKINQYLVEFDKIKQKFSSKDLSEKYNQLIVEKDEITKEIKEKGNKAIKKEFYIKCDYLLKEKDIVNEIRDLLAKEEILEKNIDDYTKVKEKINSTFFCFNDFVTLYEEKKNISKIVFDPYTVCLSLLEKEKKEKVNIYENEIEDFIEFFKKL